jgi:hypothetical protein
VTKPTTMRVCNVTLLQSSQYLETLLVFICTSIYRIITYKNIKNNTMLFFYWDYAIILILSLKNEIIWMKYLVQETFI